MPEIDRQVRQPLLDIAPLAMPVIRHGTAMALLQAGVDIAVIAVWLGHESIETTNVYVHANLAMKERALAKIQPMDTPFRRFHPDDRLLAFLESL
jgi:integrase/recombinase XerD